MLGLLALGFTSLMIYTLVKNALFGIQLNKTSSYHGSIDLIIPIASHQEINLEYWEKAIYSYSPLSDQLKIHFLFDGLQPDIEMWKKISSLNKQIKIHHFTQRPPDREPCSWMLDQISSLLDSSLVMITDPQTIPEPEALISLGSFMTEKQIPIYCIPQTAQVSTLGEVIFSLNPTLAFISLFGTKKWRQLFGQSLLGTSEGLLCLDLKLFKEIDFKSVRLTSWKDSVSRKMQESGMQFQIAFGEKYLKRFHSATPQLALEEITKTWEIMWSKNNKSAFWIYLASVFVWSFPVLCLITHPFWSLASFFLLVLFRFFTKIVFQESWTSVALHPLGSGFWVIGLVKFLIYKFKREQV